MRIHHCEAGAELSLLRIDVSFLPMVARRGMAFQECSEFEIRGTPGPRDLCIE